MTAINYVLCMLLLVCCVGASLAQMGKPMMVYYVAPNGNDDNPGTKTKPFATISRARDAARAINQQMTGEIMVMIRQGDYYLTEPIRLDERDSGMNGFTVQYCNAPGETPTLYGGTRLTAWEAYNETIYRAHVGTGFAPYNLIENGRRATMARYPKTGYLKAEARGGDRTVLNKFTFAANDLPQFTWRGAQVFSWPGSSSWNWMSSTLPITDVDFTKRIISVQPIEHQHGREWAVASRGTRYFIQNALEFLNEPGEFCYDAEAGMLYYRPRATPITRQQIVAPTVARIFDIRGASPTSLVHNIRIVGLTLNMTNAPQSIPLPSIGGVNGEPDVNCHGAIQLEQATNITISGNKILNAGLHGVLLRYAASGNTIANNWIEAAGFNGIYLYGYMRTEGGFASLDDAYVNKHNTITNNFVYDCGRAVGHGSGIQLFMSGENSITHNRIQHMPRYGISFKGDKYESMPKVVYGEAVTQENHQRFNLCTKNVIAYNDIADVVLDSDDAGAVEGFGTGVGNYVHHNRLHDYAAQNPSAIVYGFMTDDDTDHYIYEHNLVYNWAGKDPFYLGGSPNAEMKDNYRLDTEQEARDQAVHLGIKWSDIGLTRDFPFVVPKMYDFPLIKPASSHPGEDIILPAAHWNAARRVWVLKHAIGYVITGGALDPECWVAFLNIDFGKGYATLITEVAAQNDEAGKQVEIRLDSLTGPLIGQLTVQGTEGWEQYQKQTTSIQPVAGKHDVYFVFPKARTGNFASFTFSGYRK